MLNELRGCKTAVVSSELFILGRFSQQIKLNKHIIKFCNKTKTWSFKAQLPLNDIHFCVCSFKKSIYVIYETGFCFTYNLKIDKWTKLAGTTKKRCFVACTVFEGKIVVNGGSKRSVEAYDYYENKWTNLTDMIEHRYCHASVSMGNKLFVIGGDCKSSCEVFDSYSRKFTLISSSIVIDIGHYNLQAVCIGNRIMVFAINYFPQETKVFYYLTNNS